MRAVQTLPRLKSPAWHKKTASRPHSTVTSERTQHVGTVFLCASIFLLGYFPGIFVGRGAYTELGQQLAAYYMDSGRFSTWSSVFVSQAASAFVQLFLVWISGFSVIGIGFLAAMFGAKGIFMGFCAANLVAEGGGKALALYWCVSCLPNLFLLLLGLWLAGYAAQVSRRLFQSVFLGGAPRGQLESAVRRLMVRGFVAMLMSGLFCALGSGITVLIVRIF